MKWKEMSGEERYRVIQMARKGEVSMQELCGMFGMSRQTLSEAMEKAERAAMKELTAKRRGRKGATQETAALVEAKKAKAELERELEMWKTKYEIAMTFVELQRKVLDGEALPGEEVGKKRKGKTGYGCL